MRKAAQVVRDPVLRHWLFERAMGRTEGPPAFVPHRPPYLSSVELGPPPAVDSRFSCFDGKAPTGTTTFDLAGLDLNVAAQDLPKLFERDFADIEQLLALHRFAWADFAGPEWTAAIWQEWLKRFAEPDASWAWHPYTAAERAIHLLDFAERHGLPEPYADSWNALALHASAIAQRLEYFGPHYTGNHLANNGRGLLRIGTALGWTDAAELGARILLEEASRIFGPSSVLIEGSTHYHLLLARNYGQAAEWAKKSNLSQALALQAIASSTCHAAGGLFLSGGLPLIGDISPDLPPSELSGDFTRTDADLSADGWHRFESCDWSLMLYAPPDGWVPMPGHGHQDLGSFELHWQGVPLIVDPGRGAYGEVGEAALYRSAQVHNGITFAGRDPRPANRPYYAKDFRSRVGGAAPAVHKDPSSLELRYPMQGASVERRVIVENGLLSLRDRVDGIDQQRIERRLVTPWPVELSEQGAAIKTPQGVLRLWADGKMQAEPIKRWTAYGRAEPATCLLLSQDAATSWQGHLTLEPI